MNKDVIYIDVDDDVTAIIGKIKKAKEKIVALVPPKRAGALQSAVNLRLLERMAKTDHKKLVLITNNQALVALAANAKIPVAKNLQSKPELAEVAAIVVDDEDDIIDGSELPVGDHADSVKVKDGTKVAVGAAAAKGVRSDAIDMTDLDIDGASYSPAAAVGAKAATKKSGPKIPNFDTFRKKLFFGIAGGVALVGLLVWMFVFAPAATVIITASTSPQPISASVKLGGAAATNFQEGLVSSITQQEVINETVEFDATGQKDVGEKATGSVTIRNCDSSDAFSIPSGTAVSAGGQNYITQGAASVSGAKFSGGGCSTPGTSSAVAVVAQQAGESYNRSSGTSLAVAGYGSTVRAIVTSAGITGGTTKVARVVSAADIERAQGELIGRSTDEQREALTKKFANGEIIVDGSYTVDRGAIVSAPAVDEEAPNGRATLTVPTTYTLHAVPKAELDTYLKASIESKIDTNSQKLYGSGIEEATLSNFRKDGDTLIAAVNSIGNVGPKINENDIEEQVKGKRYGEVQQSLSTIDGVKDVDVKFSYFWVRNVPNNTDKIKIEFKVEDE